MSVQFRIHGIVERFNPFVGRAEQLSFEFFNLGLYFRRSNDFRDGLARAMRYPSNFAEAATLHVEPDDFELSCWRDPQLRFGLHNSRRFLDFQ